MAKWYSQCTLKYLDISWPNLDKSLQIWVKSSRCVYFFNQCLLLYVISGFYLKVDENYALLGYYAASSISLLTFRDSHPVPSSKVKNSLSCRQDSWLLKIGPVGCPETSLRNYHYSLLNSPEERVSECWLLILRLVQHFKWLYLHLFLRFTASCFGL